MASFIVVRLSAVFLAAMASGCGNVAESPVSGASEGDGLSLSCVGDVGDVNFTYEGGAGENTKEEAAANVIADGAIPDGSVTIDGPDRGAVVRDGAAIALLNFEELDGGWVVGYAQVCQ